MTRDSRCGTVPLRQLGTGTQGARDTLASHDCLIKFLIKEDKVGFLYLPSSNIVITFKEILGANTRVSDVVLFYDDGFRVT